GRIAAGDGEDNRRADAVVGVSGVARSDWWIDIIKRADFPLESVGHIAVCIVQGFRDGEGHFIGARPAEGTDKGGGGDVSVDRNGDVRAFRGRGNDAGNDDVVAAAVHRVGPRVLGRAVAAQTGRV